MTDARQVAIKVVSEIVDAFVTRGTTNCCIAASVLAAKHVPGARAVFGYAVFRLPAEGRETCFRHAWVNLDGEVHDVAAVINERLLGVRLNYTLHEDVPASLHRFDRESAEERADANATEKFIETYLRKQKEFWKQAPGWMRKWAPASSAADLFARPRAVPEFLARPVARKTHSEMLAECSKF